METSAPREIYGVIAEGYRIIEKKDATPETSHWFLSCSCQT